MPYRIQYSHDAEDHLRGLTARQRSIVLDTIDRQLAHQPTLETKNRKPLRQNPLAAWELRIGGLRVYYRMDEAEPLVQVLAVGAKRRHQGYLGETLADKLKALGSSRIASYNELWEAHKLRNQIAHGGAIDMELTKKMAKDAVAQFGNAFKEMGYL